MRELERRDVLTQAAALATVVAAGSTVLAAPTHGTTLTKDRKMNAAHPQDRFVR